MLESCGLYDPCYLQLSYEHSVEVIIKLGEPVSTSTVKIYDGVPTYRSAK